MIFGAGPVGLCAVHAARLFSPSQIILVDIDSHRLAVGTRMGATSSIQADQEDVLAVIHSLTGGKGADVAIEAAGVEKAFQQAVRCVGIGGRVSIVSIYGDDVSLPLPEIFMKNIRIEMGLSYLGNMKRLIRMIQNGQLDLTPLISHRIKLSEISKGYEMFEKRLDNVIKIAITP
ncbi:zinc-dependent alcohol dehydrogenase [Brevibacillus daliensis]|uniref:zinc-dependent alcohol dehydrogenase n=1 Tax=Brevibacillus daliensis TaxID=2892995 RepID=UPI001E3F3D04|nr:zinc-binding dehydrogenase [Brevibacillus daliensis]